MEIFKLSKVGANDGHEGGGVRLDLELRIGSRAADFPLSGVCRSHAELASEVEKVQDDLSRILKEAEDFFSRPARKKGGIPGSALSPEEVWKEISKGDEDFFVSSFNSLDDSTRREVAEFVLTHCNIFSGKGAVFSGRYSNESGLLE
jgi:hypothetical protein